MPRSPRDVTLCVRQARLCGLSNRGMPSRIQSREHPRQALQDQIAPVGAVVATSSSGLDTLPNITFDTASLHGTVQQSLHSQLLEVFGEHPLCPSLNSSTAPMMGPIFAVN